LHSYERKILVVDDEPDIRDLFIDTFVGAGYDVRAVNMGKRL